MVKKKSKPEKKSKRSKKIEYIPHWRSCKDCCNFESKVCKPFCFVLRRFTSSALFYHNGNINFIADVDQMNWFYSIYEKVTGKKMDSCKSYLLEMNDHGACPFHGMNEGSKELGQQSIIDEVRRLGIKNKLKDIKYE